jgi:hypothetical protein
MKTGWQSHFLLQMVQTWSENEQISNPTGTHMGVWQGVTMYSEKFHPGLSCLTFLGPTGRPPLKQPYSRLKGGPTAGQAAYGHLLPLWTSHAICLWEHGRSPS